MEDTAPPVSSTPWGEGSRAWPSSWDLFPCMGLGAPAINPGAHLEQLCRDPGRAGLWEGWRVLRSWDEQLLDLSCASVPYGFAHQVL